jgi:hypothetical protein
MGAGSGKECLVEVEGQGMDRTKGCQTNVEGTVEEIY